MASDKEQGNNNALPLQMLTPRDDPLVQCQGVDVRSVWYVPGSSPIVVSVPHGGTLEPPDVPTRISGCMEPDLHTAILGWQVVQSTPHSVVIGKWHWRKVDLARARETCASSPQGRHAWDEYHAILQQCSDQAIANHGFAHLIDLHGQSHRIDTTEIGNLLTIDELLKPDDETNPSRSSLSAMTSLPTVSRLTDIIRDLLLWEVFWTRMSTKRSHPGTFRILVLGL